MNKFYKIVISILLVLLIILFVIKGSSNKKIEDKYINGESISSIANLVNNQYSINEKLNSIVNNKKYTFEDPYIELNPYKISPLSAIIIFQTDNNEELKLYINGKYETTFESSKKHIIPIYGLREDFDNVIKLETSISTIEHTIKTEASNIKYPLKIAKSYKTDDLYFTVASYETYLTAWDYEGNLRFYLTTDNRMDVEWLENGHFIIGVTHGQFAENFLGFVEMDYLGKIYNYYTMENGFSFESQILSNGNIMSAGGSEAVYIRNQVIYEMNPMNGQKVSEINFTDIIKNIDPSFDEKYLGQKAIRNGFYYNEDTKELIVSFRGWDAIVSVNYETKQLNYIFTNPNNELFKNSVWDKYIIKLESGRYPLGEHSPKITNEGNIAFFNNGYNRYHGFENGGNDSVTSYSNNYSSAEIYKIDNMKARLVWKFDANKRLFSHQYGSISIDDDNKKLVNFGYVLKDDYRKSEKNTLSNAEASSDNIYARIYEIDNNNNIVFDAVCEEGKYRVFKHKLYTKNSKNTEVYRLNSFNTIPKIDLSIKTQKDINLVNMNEWIYSAELTRNTFVTNYDINQDDTIKLYLMNNDGKVYMLSYHDKNDSFKGRIFNIEIPSGKYALFIELNNQLYNPNRIYDF